MKTWSDTAFALITRVSDRFGSASQLLDSLMDRVVTTPAVKADVCGGYGWYYCPNLSYCVFAYACSGSNQLRINRYVKVTPDNCYNPQAVTCTLDVCYGC